MDTHISLPIMLWSLVFTTIALAACSIGFAWLAWAAGRRWGGTGLVFAWLIGALVLASVMTWRVRQQQTAMGVSADMQAQLAVFPRLLPLLAIALGATALVVRKRLQSGQNTFSVGVAIGSAGAFLAGVIAFFVVYALLDLTSLLR